MSTARVTDDATTLGNMDAVTTPPLASPSAGTAPHSERRSPQSGRSHRDDGRRSAAAQAVRFAVVGVASTVLYTVLFAALDTRMNYQVANVTALLFCTVLNTWVNQRFTFGAVGSERGRAAHVQSLAILAVTLAVTSGTLVLEHHLWPHASTLWDTVTVTAGNAVATIIRFWVFRRIFASRG